MGARASQRGSLARLETCWTMSAALVHLERVSHVFEAGLVKALRDVTLTIGHRELVAILGASGSGKSTLLHVLCGLLAPTSGRVVFEGMVPPGQRAWARLRATRIGFVFQSIHLLPTLTALENVQVPMFGVIKRETDRVNRAAGLLERVGLRDRMRHLPGQLSGGERQRAAIARSLANTPTLVLADEPTGNLDSESAAGVLDLFTEVHATEGVTLVVITHDLDVAQRCRRLVRVADGRLVSDTIVEGAGS